VSLVALKKKLERKPFLDPPMYFLECFTMVSNAFHALRKDKIQTIFDLSAPNVLYIFLGAPNHPKRKNIVQPNTLFNFALPRAFKFGMFNTMTSHLGMSF
jgi:hypothetical protein